MIILTMHSKLAPDPDVHQKKATKQAMRLCENIIKGHCNQVKMYALADFSVVSSQSVKQP
jgi:hypothetical protein